MTTRVAQLLDAVATHPERANILRAQRGIEKESLRIDTHGLIAQTDHPYTLGSPLTHSMITTDYSEALLEFITPVSSSTSETLGFLNDIHHFVYHQLDQELLWPASMPCALTADNDIPVARYGSSNSARIKTIYRYGLGHRYGRRMQTIAGIHYNFSMPEPFWIWLQQTCGDTRPLNEFTTDRYLGLIRNFQRWSWMLVYLFGASPAVCSSFLKGRDDHGLTPLDTEHSTYHLPDATSLRMGGLGYNSEAQRSLQVCYNQLDSYIETLRAAIVKPHPAYQQIPKQLDNEYQQLSDCLLQIENEFYSPIRPKRVSRRGEPSLHALACGGIEYIEVRCLDVNPLLPLGIDDTQIRFLDLFLLYCLLDDSSACTPSEQSQQALNFDAVVTRGRSPDLMLHNGDATLTLQAWGLSIIEQLEPLAQVLDATIEPGYLDAMKAQSAKLLDPTLTPSGRISEQLRSNSFFATSLKQAETTRDAFLSTPLSEPLATHFQQLATESHSRRLQIETNDDKPFEQFLQEFLGQYQSSALNLDPAD
jgi:glutamate--cysteine ligase